MAEHNGNVKWWQFSAVVGTIVTIFVTIMLFTAKEVIAIDERANKRYVDNKDAITELLKDNAEAHQRIISDLSEMRALLRKGISVRN